MRVATRESPNTFPMSFIKLYINLHYTTPFIDTT